jgi:hypothetical protein
VDGRDTRGRRLERHCPRLPDRGHRSWYFHASATNLLGRPERARRGGFASQAAAGRARDAWPASTEADRTAQGWTVERWLRYWLSARTRLRAALIGLANALATRDEPQRSASTAGTLDPPSFSPR